MDINANLFTANQVSRYLSIPLRTIHRLSKQGKIKSFKIGGKWFYQKSEIEKYFQFGTDFRNLPIYRNNDFSDNRAYPRINSYIECVYSIQLPGKENRIKAIIKNIGGGGLLIIGDCHEPAVEDPIYIEFKLFEDFIEATGRVVRKTENGFAIKFRDIDKFQQEEIIRYVG